MRLIFQIRRKFNICFKTNWPRSSKKLHTYCMYTHSTAPIQGAIKCNFPQHTPAAVCSVWLQSSLIWIPSIGYWGVLSGLNTLQSWDASKHYFFFMWDLCKLWLLGIMGEDMQEKRLAMKSDKCKPSFSLIFSYAARNKQTSRNAINSLPNQLWQNANEIHILRCFLL